MEFWRVFVAFLSLISFMILSNPTKASAMELEPVVVTATKTPTPVRQLPVRVDVITRDEIEKSHASDLSELLIQKFPTHFHRYPGSLTSVDIRGFRTDTHGSDIKGRVLILIDGHRAGTGNIATIPLENVERVEILRGPASVMYGSAAMGGVINLITREGKGKPTAEAQFEYGRWNRVKGVMTAHGSFLNDRVGISASGRRIEQQSDYSDGDGDTIDNTEYSDEAYSISLAAYPADNQRIMVVGQYFRAWDVGNPGATYNPDPDNYKSILRRYGSISYDGKLSDKGISWHFSGYSVHDRSSWNDPAQAWGYFSSVTETETSGLRAYLQIPTFGFGKLVAGSDWDHIEVESWKVPSTMAPWSPDTEYDNYAFYAEERISPFDKLNISAGLRYDRFDETLKETPGLIVTEDDETFDHVSWRIGATYDILDWLTARVHIGTGFRAPTADELAGRYESGMWTKIIGNPDLDPEKSVTYEAGFDGSLKGASFTFSVFYTDYSDRIVGGFQKCVNGDCSWTTYENVEGATYIGIDGSVSYDYSLSVRNHHIGLSPYLDWIYYFKRELDDDESAEQLGTDTIPYVSKGNLIAGIKFSFDELADLNIWANYHGPQKVQNWNFFSPNYGSIMDKGGFTTYSLRLDLYPVKHFSPYLYIDNLTDKDYSYVDGYPMPGITVTGGFKMKF
ncbi:MAG TPA: TonB-dependent receptor [Thermodesulforhabdus norvegica]|uniref:TonB-dependent receptor n=1 Tax=Thermodesulforhabdus norvegica TaxID=39841 RepID=A0A7C0WT20_9BACT|nr:TonB-dependent receptor [Thermodesulforhabdus norvegica]